ncbi:hypothetical protein SRHO_G00177030 [Serrasalmus rhombeus]
MCEAYKAYFGMPVGDQDKPWAPHFTCEHCKKTLEGWYRGEKRAMHFAVPRIWRKPTDHSTNCYFCMVDPSKRRTGKNATPVTYPDIPSSIAPVPHCPELPVPTPPDRATPPSEESSRSDTQEDVEDHDFSSCADEEWKPYYPNQKDLNDLIRDLGLTKSNAELLTSRLKQWNLLDESVQVTGQRKRHQVFSTFVSHQDGLCFCNNVAGLFEAIGITCNPNEWRLFIDRSCKSLKAVQNNVKWEPLVDPRKVLMPPLHIKLGLIKQFVRALDKESRAFNYLQDLFPKLSEAKIKAGVFVGPQIKKIIECSEFPKKLNRKERTAWNSFVAVVRGFLGNHKDENYVQLVQTLIKNYAAMGCRMSLKIHIFDAHLDKFKENMGAYSEEQGERFHQDIMNFECRYQGQYNENMMGDYIWGLIRESDLQYSRKSRKTTHF